MRSIFPAFFLVRIAAISLYLCGMALLFLPASELFEIKPINWHEDFIKKSAQWKNSLQTLTALTDESYTSGDDMQKRFNIELEEFIGQRTKDAIIDVSGPEWEGFFADLAATISRTDADPNWIAAKGFFKTSMSPLYSLLSKFNDDKRFSFIRITGTNKSSVYMSMTLKRSSEIMFKAPGHLAFPFRHAGLWLILAGVIIYLRQSTQAAPLNSAQFGWEKTSRGPDLIAAIFAPIFIFIGALVSGQSGSQMLSSEWFIVSGIFWFFSALFATSWLFTAYYRSYSITCDEYALTFNSLFGGSQCEISRISKLQSAQHTNPWWKKALLALGRITARTETTRKLYLDKPEPGLKIICTNGSETIIGLSGLFGLSNVFENLEQRGIQIDEGLKNYATAADSAINEPPWLVTRIFAKVVSLGAIALTVLGLITTLQTMEPEIRSTALPATPFSTLKK